MNPDQAEKNRIENTRWIMLVATKVAGHLGATDEMILPAVRTSWPKTGLSVVRDELDYLEARKLITTERPDLGPWRVKLTRHGRDVVDYTVECDAGIDRPPKYWPAT